MVQSLVVAEFFNGVGTQLVVHMQMQMG